jgi:hypothetical protein
LERPLYNYASKGGAKRPTKFIKDSKIVRKPIERIPPASMRVPAVDEINNEIAFYTRPTSSALSTVRVVITTR